MSTFVRGSNPIWSLVDLAGKQFDDTFYMWVVQNELPYLPATVYHTPTGTPWTNPIQFLANGTLPVDIYFVPGQFYRLEFRKNDGTQPPSQSDALIYEINNYIADAEGSTPIDTITFSSDNQVTNPQFSLISFTSPLSLVSVTDPDPIEIGPGWFLELAGTGSVTITQVPLNNDNANPSNAPYAMRLQLSGWNTDGVFLRQRFEQNGMLWSNKIVSSTITSRIEGAPQTINANIVDSNGSTLAQVLPITVVSEAWNEFTGHGALPATTNPDMPPAAYIEYRLALPNNADIYVTSIQLLVQDLPIEPSFEQDSVERQIDHTYHYDYPIMPVGAVIDFAGSSLPLHYLACDGSAVSRTVYRKLFAAIGTTWGVGDGSTTFNLPNLNDRVTAGSGGSLFGGTVGATGGATTHTIAVTEIPNRVPVASSASFSTQLVSVSTLDTAVPGGAVTWAGGGGGAMAIVQPTAIVRKIIRYQ